MIVQGIVFGLLAATCQSCSYIFSRIFITRPGHRPLALMGLGHVMVGVLALALLPFCWSPAALNIRAYLWPLMGSVSFYALGQWCTFQAIHRTDASRISPLLGLKILVLALIAVLIMHQSLSAWQWVAVLMSVTAALALNYSGGGQIPGAAIAFILGACVGFSLSDLSIVALTGVLAPKSDIRDILLATSLTYLLLGVAAAVAVILLPREERALDKWKGALPWAVAWFAAMVTLFMCFRMIGAVFGNIVQSTRGPISILIGMAIAAQGHVHLEQKVSRWTLVRRIAGALLMCLAIVLYLHERLR